MPNLELTKDEINWLINWIPPLSVWPHPSRVIADRDLLPIGYDQDADGMKLRVRLIAARQAIKRQPQSKFLPFEFTPAELWMLDLSMWQYDYSRAALSSGVPLMVLIDKIWDALLDLDTAAHPRSGLSAVPTAEERAAQEVKLRQFDRMIDGSQID